MNYWTAKGVMPRWSLVGVYLLVTVVFVVTASWSHDAAVSARNTANRVERESRARVAESCVSQKQRYTAAVRSLTRTYQFLQESTPSERRSTLNRAIRSGLAKQEQDLDGLRPASFCKGIGPSVPRIPPRPDNI